MTFSVFSFSRKLWILSKLLAAFSSRDFRYRGSVGIYPSRNEMALFLAGHGTKEGWRCLGWVGDFAMFIEKHTGRICGSATPGQALYPQ